MDVSLALAFAAGLLSFASPCVLALVPVYLAFLGETASVTGMGSMAATWRGPLLGQALLFVAGFTALFVLLGTSVGLFGGFLFRIDGARQVAGVAVIGIGLLTTGIFGPVLDRLWRVSVPTDRLPIGRSARALALGALVAVGWTPCIGPVLGAILTMGSSSRDAWVAALLLVAYSIGLAVPFLLAALALPRMQPLLIALRRHHQAVQIASGIFIIGIGVLILTTAFFRLAGLFTFFICTRWVPRPPSNARKPTPWSIGLERSAAGGQDALHEALQRCRAVGRRPAAVATVQQEPPEQETDDDDCQDQADDHAGPHALITTARHVHIGLTHGLSSPPTTGEPWRPTRDCPIVRLGGLQIRSRPDALHAVRPSELEPTLSASRST